MANKTKAIRSYFSRSCFLAVLVKIFPILGWLPKYTLRKLRADVIAGLAVSLMVVPQSLALASLAELPPETGLYTSFTGGFIYCLLGTSKDVTIGPTVVAAMVTNRFNLDGNPLTASSLALFSGVILLGLGIFRLGFVVQFIPSPVVGGFVSAAAIIIIVGQLKFLFGLSHVPREFFERLVHIFKSIGHANPWDMGLGLVSLGILIFLQVTSKGSWRRKKPTSMAFVFLKRSLVGLIIARGVFIVVMATLISYEVSIHGHNSSFTLAGHMPPGLPRAQFPLKTREVFDKGMNKTRTLTPLDLIKSFGTGSLVVPLILFIESISVAKAFSHRNKYKIDPTQELVALGVANIFGSFFGAFPVTGSFSRSAVNSMSGVATPLSGVFASIIVILAIEFITPLFHYIPMAALGAMVIAAVITMIEIRLPLKIYRIHPPDLLLVISSFALCFYEIEMGILVGCLAGLVLILYRVLKPRIDCTHDETEEHVTISIHGGLWYPAVESVKDTILAASEEGKTVVVDLQHVFEMDFSIAQCLTKAAMDVGLQGGHIKIINAPNEHVTGVLDRAGVLSKGKEMELDACDTEVNLGDTVWDLGDTELDLGETERLLESDRITRCLIETVV